MKGVHLNPSVTFSQLTGQDAQYPTRVMRSATEYPDRVR